MTRTRTRTRTIWDKDEAERVRRGDINTLLGQAADNERMSARDGNENRLEICSTLYGQDTLVQLKDDDSGVARHDDGTVSVRAAVSARLRRFMSTLRFGSVRFGSAQRLNEHN